MFDIGAIVLSDDRLSSDEYRVLLGFLERYVVDRAHGLWKAVFGEKLSAAWTSSIHRSLEGYRNKWMIKHWLQKRADRPLLDFGLGGPIKDELVTESRSIQAGLQLAGQPDPALSTSIASGDHCGAAAKRQEILEQYKLKRSQEDHWPTDKEIWAVASVLHSTFYLWKRGGHVSRNCLVKLAAVLGRGPEEIDGLAPLG
jgi:hypothetical protein